jgi:glucan 1,3-beta-glucosidase
VKDFGAKGDGITDDSDAIINALSMDRNFQPSTMTPAFVYFPPGTYKITKVLHSHAFSSP